MNDYRPLFICGMSRGGTTWLGNCLNEHPNVAVFGESLYWGRNYLAPSERGVYSDPQVKQVLQLLTLDCKAFLGEGRGNLKQIDRERWQRMLGELNVEVASPAGVFQAVCEEVKRQEQVDYVVEKTPHHVNWIPRILDAYPKAKFVVMVRDPYGFMLSYKHQGDRKQSLAKRDFRALYHPLACSFIWRRYIKSALQMNKRYPQQTLTVKFEELRTSPELCWSKVLNFFDFPNVPLVATNDRNSSFTGQRHSLDSIDVFWMNLVSGGMLKAGGFKRQRSGASLLTVLRSICGLFPWGFRAAKLLKSRIPAGIMKYLFGSGK